MAHAEGRAALPLAVTVAFSPEAGCVEEVVLQLAEGATVQDALNLSGLVQRYPVLGAAAFPCGVWGRLCAPSQRLQQLDRVEFYRPLQVDPKEARRRRQHIQRTERTQRLTP